MLYLQYIKIYGYILANQNNEAVQRMCACFSKNISDIANIFSRARAYNKSSKHHAGALRLALQPR
jgi:hypothetical protein